MKFYIVMILWQSLVLPTKYFRFSSKAHGRFVLFHPLVTWVSHVTCFDKWYVNRNDMAYFHTEALRFSAQFALLSIPARQCWQHSRQSAPSAWVPKGDEAEQNPEPTSNEANKLGHFKPLRFGGCMLVWQESSYLDMYKYEGLNIHNSFTATANIKTCFHSVVISFDAKKNSIK